MSSGNPNDTPKIPLSDTDDLMRGLRPASPLPRFRASDAIQPDDDMFTYPIDNAHGKSHSKSLMRPQDLARRLLPKDLFLQLQGFCYNGCIADCGPDWSPEVIKAAAAIGPHVSALLPESATLIWEDIDYQVAAGFVKLISETKLFGPDQSPKLKISRVALVPQANRRGRIILNLSAAVNAAQPATKTRKKRRADTIHMQASVNETTTDAEDQSGVEALGPALPSILKFMHDTDCEWEIDWQKIDLSDGFWRMIVESGQEFNFVFQMPQRPGDSEIFYVVPSSLQMGWTNSPAYFCVATRTTRELIKRMLAVTLHTGIAEPHDYESFCMPDVSPDDPTTSDRLGNPA